jgi:hypothetical protein
MKGMLKRGDKVEGLDSRVERLICIGLIVSARVCRELAPIAKDEMFCSDFTKWVATKALDFYKRHEKPPLRHIEDVFHKDKRAGMNSSLAESIEEFLKGISAEFEDASQFNEGYVIDAAVRYFKARSLRAAAEDARALVDEGRIEEAEKIWSNFKRVDKIASQGVNPFTNSELIKRAFERVENPLFEMPGAVGQLLSVQLHRKNFLSFRGVVGRGKTFTLQELAKCAARARLNVAFIGVGDMSEEEYTMRWLESIAGRSSDPEDCEPMWIPCMDCWLNQTGACRKNIRKGKTELPAELRELEFPHPDDAPDSYVPCSVCSEEPDFKGASWWTWREAVKPLDWAEGLELGRRFMKRLKGKDFKLQCFPSKGVTPSGLESLMERWRDYENWLADVIIVDYMDELGSDESDEQFRHREAAKWSACRGLAFKWNLLMVGADQGDTDSYTRETIGLDNFNEDRRRNDVLTGGIGINQTPAEKARGIVRWAYFKLRKGHYGLSDQVSIVQALGQGRPVVGSWWRKHQ